MHQIALLFVCLFIGVALRLTRRLPENASKVMGGWVINVALPAAAIRSLHKVSVHADWWLAALTPWAGATLAIIVLVPLCRSLGWSAQRTGALVLVGGWGNTSFVGLPMIAALAGSHWLGLGIVIDLLGSYLALSTLGLAVATIASTGRMDWRVVALRIATFPPFLAILIAFATNHLEGPEWLTQTLDSLADTLTPVALAAVGYALRADRIAGRVGSLLVGLGFRLLLAPLAIVIAYVAVSRATDPAAQVAMLEMAMPPMLGASVIAIDHDLEPDLVGLLIGLGVPLSIGTAVAWWSIIGHL